MGPVWIRTTLIGNNDDPVAPLVRSDQMIG